MFQQCNNIEELKATYKEYVKVLHPDRGGNTESFQDMIAQYEQRKEELLNPAIEIDDETKKIIKDACVAVGESLITNLRTKKPNVAEFGEAILSVIKNIKI